MNFILEAALCKYSKTAMKENGLFAGAGPALRGIAMPGTI
jgi:hypothetical protein